MEIKSCSFGVTHPKLTNIRRNFMEVERALGDDFLALNLLPIPDEAPNEIPRITTNSPSGHSVLNLSAINSTIITNFDGDYTSEWTKPSAYIERKANLLITMLKNVFGITPQFIGLITQIFIDDENPINRLSTKLLKKPPQSIYDLDLRIAHIIEPNFFVNVSISNVHFYEGLLNPTLPLRLAKEMPQKIGITLDINDRYGFNFNPDFESSGERLTKILQKVSDIINNKFETFISEGDLSV